MTKRELTDLMEACSSLDRRGIWKKRAVLNGNGVPIPLESFMELERTMLRPIHIERNTREEIKLAKKVYAREKYATFGANWKKELKRNVIRLTTFRQLRMLQYSTANA